MYESKYSFLMKMAQRSLSEEKRIFHSFIEEIELAYVEQAETAEQYFNLLTLQHPYQQAAAKFNMTWRKRDSICLPSMRSCKEKWTER